jgi:hypothetical protein
VPIVAVVVCATAIALPSRFSWTFKDFLPYLGLHAALLLAALWVFRRSQYWRRRSGVQTEWQFSLAQLLFVMTIVALLAATMRQSAMNDLTDVASLGLLAGSVVMAIASVAIWSRDIHWLLRLASVLAAAIGLSAMFILEDRFMVMFTMMHFLVQAIVISSWLALGDVLPIMESPAVADNG